MCALSVYGLDEFAGAEELVDALLEDPFVSEHQKDTIRNRWRDRTGPLVLQYSSADEPTDPTSNTLEIPSSWLQRFPTRVSIHEYSTSKSASRSPSIAKDLFTADIPILVLNPLSTPPSSVLSSHHLPTAHPHAIYVLTSSPSSKTPNLTKYAKRTVVVDPTRALAATRALASSPSSAVAVQRYQDDYTASGLSSIGQSIDSVLSSSPPSTPPLVSLRLRKAQYIVRTALALSEASLDAARSEVDAAFMGASELRTLVEEARVRVPVQVLGEDAKGEVREALRRARKEVALTMDGLSWWRALWRVDDIRHIVGAAVERAWCRDLERKLIFHSGTLSALQHSLTQTALSALSPFDAPSPLHSPILHNALAQLRTAPTHAPTPLTLTTPLRTRLAQLAHPTAALHAAAQRAALVVPSSVLGGAGAAWAGWVGLLEVGMGMSAETALGAGLLGAVAGVRWAVSGWERARRRWWRDWDRVGEGLERDLKAVLDETLEQRVLSVPKRASEGLEDLAARRKEQIEELREEREGLVRSADALESMSSGPA